MQVVLNSNKTSLVQNTLTSDGNNVHSLAYSVQESFPNISKKCSKVSPYIGFSGAPDNNSFTFNIPRSNFWYLGRLQLNFTGVLAAGDLTSYTGLNIIRQIDTVCNGQPIMSMTGEALKALVMNSPVDLQQFSYRYALPLNPATEKLAAAADTTWTSYVPLIASWFMSPEQALNCSELEQIQLVVTFKTYQQAGLNAAVTALTSSLFTYKYLPDAETYSKIITANLSSPLLETFNTITERMQVLGVTGGGTAGVDLVNGQQIMISNIFYPVYKTHVFIAKNDTSGTQLGCPYLPIQSISLDVGGENYFTNFTRSTLNYEQAWRKNSDLIDTNNTALTVNENQIFTIDWSLLCKRDSNTGLASMANLNKPQYTLNITTPITTGISLAASETFGSYWIYLVHEFWQVLEIDPASRVISVRANH